jgi:hypothetical protein
MRPYFSVIVPILLSLTRVAHAQVEAAFPPEPTPGGSGASQEGAAPTLPPNEQSPGEKSPAEKSPDDSRATPPPQTEQEPSAATQNEKENPYGAPPPPPSSIPGNPYGTVPHRAPTPATNPYVGAAPAATSPQAEAAIEETNWSVGGGLTGEPTNRGAGFNYGGGYPPSPQFSSSLLFERRLGRSLFLLAQPRGLYHKGTYEPPNPGLESAEFEELRLGLEAGIRWVANPGGVVEVGMSHLASVEYNQYVQDGPGGFLVFGAESVDADQVVVGLSNAFLAERRLIPHLWLRLGVGLFGMHYYSTKIVTTEEVEDEVTGETNQTEEDSSDRGIRAGLSPSFSLQVRLAF